MAACTAAGSVSRMLVLIVHQKYLRLRGEEDFFVAEHVTANIICVFFV
jgi:hypothetical protein